MNYTIVSGTNRPDSNSLKIAKYYNDQFQAKKIKANLIDLQDLPADFIFSDMYGKRTERFDQIQKIVSLTDKFIFIIPEYNGSFPGVLKAFIDASTFPESFAYKKCALVGLSSGKFGNLRGLEHFTGVCNYIKIDVFHNKMYLPAIDGNISDNGKINNKSDTELINWQIDGFIKF